MGSSRYLCSVTPRGRPSTNYLKGLPNALVEQKRRRLHKQAHREWVTVSDDQRLLCQYEVLIINVPGELLGATQVREFYRLRWQVELIFKAWKSLLGLHQVVSSNLYWFQAQLLANLSLVLLGSPLVSSLKTQYWQDHQKELSNWYLWRWLRDQAYELAAQLGRGIVGWQRWISAFMAFANHNARKHKRKHKGVTTRPLPYEIITQMA
ncbi:transposase [Spirosoma sp. KNUC1025]|uniref:transposase n=1 Tax=Spirosoma sp. KNUC1025 TaxID=2894082 RepID=UPI001E584905|nr:transposase [Spirosoma sp. KNUC1025]